MLATARTLEAKAIHQLQLNSLRDLTAVHIESLFRFTKLAELCFIPIPLVRNDISATHTPDRNDHVGGTSFWLDPGNQILQNLRVALAALRSYPR